MTNKPVVCIATENVLFHRMERDLSILRDFGQTSLQVDDIQTECHYRSVESLFNGLMYNNDVKMPVHLIKPISGSLEAVRAIRNKGFRVIFNIGTHFPNRVSYIEWLFDNDYLDDESNGGYDIISSVDKSLIRCKYFISTMVEDLDSLEKFDGRYLVKAPWNRFETSYLRHTLGEIVKYLEV